MKSISGIVVFAGAAALAAPNANAVTINFENTQASGGFSFTPMWYGLHDGSFNMFDAGSPASSFSGIEDLAELGDPAGVMSRFTSDQPSGVQTVVMDSTGAPVYSPGESAAVDLDPGDAGVNQYLSFGSMVVPSNDLFIGADNAVQIFDSSGEFLGPVTIEIYGADVWDAGTEVNDIMNGAAFIDGGDAMQGAEEGENIHAFFTDPDDSDYIDSIIGMTAANGQTITTGFDEETLIGRITIVPSPGSASVLALAGFAGLRRRRR